MLRLWGHRGLRGCMSHAKSVFFFFLESERRMKCDMLCLRWLEIDGVQAKVEIVGLGHVFRVRTDEFI